MNRDLLTNYDEETRRIWRRTRINHRTRATIAHEIAEHEYKDLELGLAAGPETTLPRSHLTREPLGQMERGWRGK
jgi:hypothetical protein